MANGFGILNQLKNGPLLEMEKLALGKESTQGASHKVTQEQGRKADEAVVKTLAGRPANPIKT